VKEGREIGECSREGRETVKGGEEWLLEGKKTGGPAHRRGGEGKPICVLVGVGGWGEGGGGGGT